MKMINVVNGPQNASAIILGCMRMPALSVEQAAAMIRTGWPGLTAAPTRTIMRAYFFKIDFFITVFLL